MYRGGLDRFRKAQSLEPFAVSKNAAPAPKTSSPLTPISPSVPKLPASDLPIQNSTQIGGGQSTWQPPDWAIEPRPGVFYLDIVKDGEVLGQINLDKRRHIFGRQHPTCDFVLDHQSVSRQHAAVVPHKNGSIFVIDLGSAHGTFVANERLKKDIPVELEVGQSLRFAASTRIYVLRKNTAALFSTPALPPEIDLSSPPDPSDEEAVLLYNTTLNRYGLKRPESAGNSSERDESKRPSKKARRLRVAFKDQVGGELAQVVGISDGADVGTEPGPIGVKEGSLVGKYESLVHVTVIPKGKEQNSSKEEEFSPKGVTDKLQQALNRVKGSNVRRENGLYGDVFSGMVGSSWAYSSSGSSLSSSRSLVEVGAADGESGEKRNKPGMANDEDEDDLFGD